MNIEEVRESPEPTCAVKLLPQVGQQLREEFE